MLDSGAFTAWNKGKEVDRDALVDFYNRAVDDWGDCIDLTCIALDRIPGRQGVTRTAQDFVDAAAETVANYEWMIPRVHAPVKPVYHDGEPDWVLKAYRDAPYIGLSANQDQSYEDREGWVLENDTKFAGKQLHGLAMTGTRMLRVIRWHSIDSAAWVLWAGMGALAFLRDDGSLKILPSSIQSPRKKMHGGHATTITEAERSRLEQDLRAEELTMEIISRDSMARSRWSILVFKRACDWAAQQPVLSVARKIGRGKDVLFP